MEKVVGIYERKAPVQKNSFVEKNLEYARAWYLKKKHEFVKGMRIKVTDAGSSQHGSIKNAVLTISFQPPFGSKFMTIATPLFLAMNHDEFIFEIDRTFKDVKEYALNAQ